MSKNYFSIVKVSHMGM